MKRRRRRTNAEPVEQATFEGLKALSAITQAAREIGEQSERVFEAIAVLETAVEMNFWIERRLARTRELNDHLEDWDAYSEHLRRLREEFLACVAIEEFLSGLGAWEPTSPPDPRDA